MNRKIMPFMLFAIEIVMYYFICLYFNMDNDLILGSGTLYFLFLFIYGHYSLNTCLISLTMFVMFLSNPFTTFPITPNSVVQS